MITAVHEPDLQNNIMNIYHGFFIMNIYHVRQKREKQKTVPAVAVASTARLHARHLVNRAALTVAAIPHAALVHANRHRLDMGHEVGCELRQEGHNEDT